MYVRKFRSDRAELLEEARSVVSADADAKYLYRVAMVSLVLAGMPPSELAGYGAAGERTIVGWVTKADAEGIESLRARRQTGRPPRLTAEQRSRVSEMVSRDPGDYGYEAWTGSSLSDLIMQEFNIELKPRSCAGLLRGLGVEAVRADGPARRGQAAQVAGSSGADRVI